MTPERDIRAVVEDSGLEESAEELYEHAPCAHLSTLPDGTIVKVNQTLLGWTGHSRDELLGRRRFQDLLTPGGRIYHETHYAPLLHMQDEVRGIALDLASRDGGRLPVLATSELRRDRHGRPLVIRTTLFDATDRKAYERELLLLRRREQAARERTDQLQRLTAALGAALNAEEVCAAVAAGVTAGIGAATASVAVVDPVDRRVLEVHPRSAAAAARRGESPATVEPVFEEGADASAVLPLVVEGRLVGVLTVTFQGARELPADDRAFLTTCAQQAAQALERARRYEHERDVAHALQRSMLPAPPAADPRYGVATYYRPGVETLEVGGDFYDTFPLGDDRVAIAVGDVVGRGIDAAAAMGQLRSAMRALATSQLGPAGVLAHLDAYVEHLDAARAATVAYAEIALGTGVMRFACAGHPPPVLLSPDGTVRLLWDGRSPPLSVAFGSARREAEVTLAPGARVLLYTDGVVERRDRPLDDGLERLMQEFRSRRGRAIGHVVDELTDVMLADRASNDDVCLLCLALSPAPVTGSAQPQA